ncbi:energy transducer TonB [Hyphomonas sp.]|uniref:energy transducer TonB n=1 Tax=Hyphomonas sp. TaxID=87 RepID=UPI0030027D37
MNTNAILWPTAFVCAFGLHALGLSALNFESTSVAVPTETEREIILAPLGSLDGALTPTQAPAEPEPPAPPPPRKPKPKPAPKTPPPPPPRIVQPDPARVVIAETPEPVSPPATDANADETPRNVMKRTETQRTASAAGGGHAASRRDAPAPFGLPSGVEKSQAQYAGLIQAWLLKHKRYPHPARARRQQGVVKVWFQIDPAGHILEQRIETSSGHALLDKATLNLLRAASPLPPPPAELHATDLTFTVPIDYSLN